MGTQLSQERTFALFDNVEGAIQRCCMEEQRPSSTVTAAKLCLCTEIWRHKGPGASKNLYQKIQNYLRDALFCKSSEPVWGTFTLVEITQKSCERSEQQIHNIPRYFPKYSGIFLHIHKDNKPKEKKIRSYISM